jgi:type VI protein secretion system component VasF
LAALWVSPGDGQEPLESILDTYAISLMLGYKGRFYEGDTELSGLRELAREQLTAWRQPVQPRPKRVGRNFLGHCQRLWRDYGWAVTHLLLPSCVLLILWLKMEELIDSLPF